jgi:hypothetical protein
MNLNHLKLHHELAQGIIADRQHACLMAALRSGRGLQTAIIEALVEGHNRRRERRQEPHTVQGWAVVGVRS